ncbi:hypothetical protein BK133_02685 [Paenibacillus sp. FSL H8-0548]|uniref:hypothetical protein n=1 Tax=Paenibacillus sp. FSL H8-0548 TaxID=1920422 RepID=UPI00096D0274|nr:hypothetical protein [Paenibacillus sp. FSL H8-0548]OMF38443.1 hypothetical protein BK133_02685 [Paenibacillus sp. FSL H8-0548]
MAKRKDKWRKWKIGAGSATAVMMLFGAIQNSETFKRQALEKSQDVDGDSYVAEDGASETGFAENWQSEASSGRGSYGRGNGSTGSGNDAESSGEGEGYWTERESTGAMSSRTGKS